ncbi:unnamed protein product [Callosobruchus maculatus]|uniref:Uncharacterized protein n=1 Tax=Callosobruchus maculatus TaxID=64391 RepID=A0A653BYV6_CALMS|nr:unnamed protein product [Callosobruchus maculatus]
MTVDGVTSFCKRVGCVVSTNIFYPLTVHVSHSNNSFSKSF